MKVQTTFFGGASKVGSHVSLIKGWLGLAIKAHPGDDEESKTRQNRLVHSFMHAYAARCAGFTDVEKIDALTRSFSTGDFPAPDTVARRLRDIREGRHGHINSEQSYAEYLRSTEWLRRRAAYESRHPKKCQICGVATGRIELHHNTYDRLYAELDTDLIWLCRPHHAKFHGKDE